MDETLRRRIAPTQGGTRDALNGQFKAAYLYNHCIIAMERL